MMLMNNLIAGLRARRKELSLTQAQLAARAGIARRTLLRVEAGDPSVKIGTYAQAAQALGFELALVRRSRPSLDELDSIYDDE